MVRTRFAPSPTGFLHIGGLRTAAYAYALAKHSSGQFILRIEDTDQKREVPHAREKIFTILKEFHLNWDEGPLVGGPYAPYIQSERVSTGIYKLASDRLISEGHAFYCFCSPKSKAEIESLRSKNLLQLRDPCRDLAPDEIKQKIQTHPRPAVRLRVPDTEFIKFTDFVSKKTTVWESRFVDDAMLLKSDGFPTYHLAMPVDDTQMAITHVLRGAEWFSSTPIHLLLFKYLNYPLPHIGHLSSILDPEGGKLSKRKGNTACEQFISSGYLPEALLNFVVLLGWAPKDNQELFTIDEFVAKFSPDGFQKSNPRLLLTKLNWLNGQYLRKLSTTELVSRTRPFVSGLHLTDVQLAQLLDLTRDRLVTLAQFPELIGFFIVEPDVDKSLFTSLALTHLKLAYSVVSQSDFSLESLNNRFKSEISEASLDTSDFFMDLRIAITGSRQTPPITQSILILGQQTSLDRIQKAINLLS